MREQETNGYYICGNDYVAVCISLEDEKDSHVFTLGDQAAFNQAVCRAEEGPATTKRAYIVEATIPRTSRDGILFVDPEVRDQRLLDLSVYLASQFKDEPTHTLRAAGAVGVRMTKDQALKLKNHSMVKAVRLNRRIG